MSGDWEGRTAIITGASRGIGAAVARTLAAAGAHVALMARDAEALDAVARDCRAQAAPGTPEALVVPVDVADASSLEQAVAGVLTAFEYRLDLLANVAGSSLRHAKLQEMTDQDWQATLDLNLMAPVRLQRSCFDALLAAEGAIVNVGSVVADYAAVLGSTYAAAKAALQSLTRSTALEWARHGIRAVCVEPGYVATDFNARLVEAGLEDRLLARVPTRQAIQPQDVADLIVFAGSPASRHLTGATIKLDGGYSAGL